MQHSLFGVTIHPETSFGLATENYVAVLSDNFKFAQYTVYSMYIYIYTYYTSSNLLLDLRTHDQKLVEYDQICLTRPKIARGGFCHFSLPPT